MKKILLVTIIIAMILAIVSVFKIFKNDKKESVETESTKSLPESKEMKEEAIPLSGNGSLNAIMAFGKNLECSISYQTKSAEKSKVEGTFFSSNNQMRGDFLMPEIGPDAVSSVIMQKDMMYSWTETAGKKYGMKISTNELSSTKMNDDSPEAGEVVPFDATVFYDCKPWITIDGSIFEPPTDVIFKDYNDLINTGMEYGNIYDDKGGEN